MRRSKIAISWLEICLIAALTITGMGTWLFVNQQVDWCFRDRKPEVEEFQLKAHLLERKRELTFFQNELTTNQSKLVEQRIELARHTAQLQALEKIYPQLGSDSSKKLASLSPDISKSYQQVRIEKSTAENLVDVFEKRLDTIKFLVVNAENAVFKSQDTASKALTKAQMDYERNKTNVTFGYSMGAIAIITTIFFIILSFLPKEALNINLYTIFFGAISIQSVLIGYQSFNVIGAALATLLLLLFFSILISVKSQKSA